MKRRHFLKSSAAAASAAMTSSVFNSCTNASPPNVLLVLMDDQGWSDVGFNGNPLVETPHLDAFARESVRFENFYVAPCCAPTRASLLTGRHFLKTGVSHVHGGNDFIHPNEKLISQYFRDAGYATGMWGKWHSGKTTGYLPWERGFDDAYMARLYRHYNSFGKLNGQDVKHEGWTVDTLTDYTLNFIERNRNRPWFAFLSHLTVHAPLRSSEELIKKYAAKGIGERLATIYAMMEQFDSSFGRLLNRLDELGERDNTVIVFLSDNGPQYFDDMSVEDLKKRYTSGYKGHKGSLWENGIKSPLWVQYGKKLKAGSVQQVADVTDILPTLLDICAIPHDSSAPAIDGLSLKGLLHGEQKSLAGKEVILYSNLGWPPEKTEEEKQYAFYNEYKTFNDTQKKQLDCDDQLGGVRTNAYKYMHNPGSAQTPYKTPIPIDNNVLIDMKSDPRENANIAAMKKDSVLAMQQRFCSWFDTVKYGPHSFHIPRFVLGPGTTNKVCAYAPLALSGNVFNQIFYSADWKEKGDAGEYRIEVRKPGRYRIKVWTMELEGDIELSVSAGNNKLAQRLTEGKNWHPLGMLTLETGKQLLKVAVKSSSRNASTRIRELFFEYVG